METIFANQFTRYGVEVFKKYIGKDDVFVCVGTSSVLADSLGPKVGQMLNDKMKIPLIVYGTTQNNVNATNLQKSVEIIRNIHRGKRLVVVDAGVGKNCEKGEVQIDRVPLVPGAATGKGFAPIGDVSVIGVVATDVEEFFKMDSQCGLVDKMANIIAETVLCALQ